MAKPWTGRTRRVVVNDRAVDIHLVGAPMEGPDGWPYLWIGRKVPAGGTAFVGALDWGDLCRLADLVSEARVAAKAGG